MANDSPNLLLYRLAINSSKNPNKTAISFLSSGPNGGKEDSYLSYSELSKETSNLAGRLLESGLSKGDRAVLVYPPSLDYMVAFLACLKAGIVAVPVFPPNPSRKDTLIMFSRIVDGCGAKHALTSSTYNHMKKLAGIKDTFTRMKQPVTAWPEQLQWMVTNDNKKATKVYANEYSPIHSDLAFLQYTSGSTSEPKGVMITHGNLAHNLTIITNELKAVDDTVVVSWLPQYHDMGLIGSYLGVLYCGGSGYYMSPLSFLQRPMLWMEAASKYHATHLQAPNFAFKLTARKFEASQYNSSTLQLSSVRHVINAAEPVDEDSIQTFEKAFRPFGFGDVMSPTYGLAEHTVFVCSGGKQRLNVSKQKLEVDGVVLIQDSRKPDSSPVTRLVGCGYPTRQGVDVRIVNAETMQQMSEDHVGEIWVRSLSKAAGYFGKPEETKRDFYAQLSGATDDSPDGFLRTGDLGFLHDGELFICGRLKDLIIISGRNYYPQDIESTAESSSMSFRPGCSAAFTIDSTREGGEEVALVIELQSIPNAKDVDSICIPLANTIRSTVNQEHSLGLSYIAFLRPKTIPKTSSGKIARAWCRKAFIANSLDVVYSRAFKESISFEIDQSPVPAHPLRPNRVQEIRAMDKNEIVTMLAKDMAKIGSVQPDALDKDAALVAVLDSLSISQFKGLLEAEYGVNISDEYLFRESTSLKKLAEVVKLGYAPDDGEGGDISTPISGAPTHQSTGGGLASALGCPPGVVCCVLM